MPDWFPAVDFPLYGLPGDVDAARRLHHVEGRLGDPPFSVWLWHGEDVAPGRSWVLVGSGVRSRIARRVPDPVPDIAFTALFAVIGAVGDAVLGGPVPDVDAAEEQANRYRDWPEATWTLDGRAVPARVVGWAGVWAGFTVEAGDVDVMAVGPDLDGLRLVRLTDTTAYGFDLDRPLERPVDDHTAPPAGEASRRP